MVSRFHGRVENKQFVANRVILLCDHELYGFIAGITVGKTNKIMEP
jgi:hypothetical protein